MRSRTENTPSISEVTSCPLTMQKSKAWHHCEHCGTWIDVSFPTFREIAIDLLCICLLFALLIATANVSGRWVDRETNQLRGHLFWHEPLEGWNH
jgi:hypothetical protein